MAFQQSVAPAAMSSLARTGIAKTSSTSTSTGPDEANDDRQLQHRYMQIEGMAELNTNLADDKPLALTPQAA